MNQANKQYLDDHRILHTQLINAGTLMIQAPVKDNFQRIMAEEFRRGYTADLYCGVCVADMVKHLYMEYDKWLAAQPMVPDPEQVPIKNVKANFPNQKKKS